MRHIYRFTLAIVFTVAGFLHFKREEGFERVVPDYLPFKRFIVHASGIAEILFGLLLFVRRPGKVLKSLINGFLLLVFPANIYMARKELPLGSIDLPKPLLYLRLPLQFVLMGMVKRM